MKYPNVVFFRHEEYAYIDAWLESKKNALNCTMHITSDKQDLNQLFDSNFPILITFGDVNKYLQEVHSVVPDRMRKRWIHYNELKDEQVLNREVNYCFIHVAHTINRPVFSLFTTCYKSYHKILRAYESIQAQTYKDWEWVILDDSPEDEHFVFLRNTFANDKRVRLYKRSENSGNIGNVKNEIVMLCRGEYLLEMDHDDEIVPDMVENAVKVFESHADVGFIYMDYCNIYENGANFKYGDFFSLGYAGYYCVKYKGRWRYVASTPNVNNVTLSHIVAVPNHPRIWRKKTLLDIGNYSEFLPISDDYELLIRTAMKTKMAKIHKLGYIQYMNDNNNNFSLIRNSEINRLCAKHIYPQYFDYYKIEDTMKSMNAYEPMENIPIWKKPADTYEPRYCNHVINTDFAHQYCILGLEAFHQNIERIQALYQDPTNDFLLLENAASIDSLTSTIDSFQFDRMKCYNMSDCTYDQLKQYFKLIYKSCTHCDYIVAHNHTLTPTPTSPKITIITPSIRPENLCKVKESILFDYVHEWFIVYDGKAIRENPHLFQGEDKITELVYYDPNSISGNGQRNHALDILETRPYANNTYVYYLDDDNIVHPSLYSLLERIEANHIYTFDQVRPTTVYPHTTLLPGNCVELNKIDTAMFLIDANLCKGVRWVLDKYNADGYYITECFGPNKQHWIYVNQTMAYYNSICSMKMN